MLLDAHEDTEEQQIVIKIGEWEAEGEGEVGDEELGGELLNDDEEIPLEKQFLPLPYSRKCTAHSSDRIQRLIEKQLQLEQGHANDALHKVRLAIGHKSFLYRHQYRHAPNYDTRTRSGKSIRTTQANATYNADIYTACRTAMEALGAGDEVLEKYKKLAREDLRANTSISDPNPRGARNERLSWIWGMHRPDDESTDWMDECE